MSLNKKLVSIIAFVSLIFFLIIGKNISPFLRGPGEWPPEWRWPYLFVNTTNKLWLPLIIILITFGFTYFIEKRKVKLNNWLFLILFISLSYLFQLSILYFSRSGLSVLIHRIINPDLNGYFTEAMKINNLSEFIANYQKNVLSFSMHATGHPPGVLLFFWVMEKIVNLIPFLKSISVNLIPYHFDVKLIWNSLTITQRSTAIISAFLIPFLGSLNIIPLYFLVIKLFNYKTAIRATLISIFVPALTLFTPLPDVFFSLFFLASFYFFIKGLNDKNMYSMLLSGLIFSIGLFFSLTILPLIFINIFYLIKNKNIKLSFYFVLGSVIFYLVLYLFKYKVFTVSYTLMTGLPKNRSYLSWIFYNLYDFFVFTGIPIIIIYLTMFVKKIKEPLFVAFTIMLLILNFSGAVKGEVGRIWIPLMFPLVIIVSSFITNKIKLSTNLFMIILLFQALQVIILQEFWVMLW